MADAAGKWNLTVNSPLGEQHMVLTVTPDGAGGFAGDVSGALGSLAVADGRIDGDTLTWTMQMTMPMPMALDCNATIDGDTITGGVKAGAFGVSPLKGVRAA